MYISSSEGGTFGLFELVVYMSCFVGWLRCIYVLLSTPIVCMCVCGGDVVPGCCYKLTIRLVYVLHMIAGPLLFHIT